MEDTQYIEIADGVALVVAVDRLRYEEARHDDTLSVRLKEVLVRKDRLDSFEPWLGHVHEAD